MGEESLINGIEARELLKSLSDHVYLHKKDNTDKLWSYKIHNTLETEFAFDPNAKTKGKMSVWFDCKPPTLNGVSNVQDISNKSNRTSLGRVFSGGEHTAKYKATIESKDALIAVIEYFLGASLKQGAAFQDERNNAIYMPSPKDFDMAWQELRSESGRDPDVDDVFKRIEAHWLEQNKQLPTDWRNLLETALKERQDYQRNPT